MENQDFERSFVSASIPVSNDFIEKSSRKSLFFPTEPLSIPLTLALPRKFPKTFPARSHQAVVQIQKLAVEVFEFVPLLDENVQEKFFENFWEGQSKWN